VKDKIFEITSEISSVFLDGNGNIQKISFMGKDFEPPMKYTLYGINGEVANVSETRYTEEELSLGLTTKAASGRLTVSRGKEIRFHFDPDKKDAAKNVSLILPFPLDTEFHIPERYNLGRKIDRDMPVSDWYSTPLGYNFFLANFGGMWIRFMTKHSSLKSTSTYHISLQPKLYISRHPEAFIVTFTWKVEDDAFMIVFSSLDDAIRDYEKWLGRDLRIRKLKDDKSLPEWVHNVKLVLTIDMMRSNGEIAHDYNDVINLAKDLKKTECPKDTLLYIPGHSGPYDSAYPSYEPCSELGGGEKFKEMVEALHENGFRVMMHTNAWGLDPYHPRFDEYEKYLLRDEDGNYQGWQTGGKIWGGSFPASRPLDFRTDEVPFHASRGTKSFTFETVPIPDICEALLNVGNIEIGDARLKFTINQRSVLTPPAWFKDHDEYALPFPFMLNPGSNEVHVEIVGEAKPNWSESWYKIRYCFMKPDPFSGFSYPILLADMNNPEWIKIVIGEIASVVRKYKIDAIHIDATHYDRAKKMLNAIKEELPDLPTSGEEIETLGDMGYSTFCQNARESLIGNDGVAKGVSLPQALMRQWRAGILPDKGRIKDLLNWLNKPSPVCNFVKNYVYVYPHLCVADGFVPVGRVCCPSYVGPRTPEEFRKLLLDAPKLNYIPGLRLNYRRYGIDKESERAIRAIGKQTKKKA